MEERTYEVRVDGLVHTQDLLDELSDVEVAEHEFRTVLTGHFADQAALHGFLHRLRAYGLEVVEVRRVATTEEAGPVRPVEDAAPSTYPAPSTGPAPSRDAAPSDDAAPSRETGTTP